MLYNIFYLYLAQQFVGLLFNQYFPNVNFISPQGLIRRLERTQPEYTSYDLRIEETEYLNIGAQTVIDTISLFQ